MRVLPATVAVVLAAAAMPAAAELPGVLEAGVGGLAMSLPDYRGSEQSGGRFLPFPYLFYEGRRVQVSRDGLRARLFALESVSVSLSVGASLPGSDSDDPPREGMDEIMPTFEAGPSLDWTISEDPAHGVRLRLPFRAVLATNLKDFEGAGWLFHPHLRVDRRWLRNDWRIGVRTSAGALWATAPYHDYFYGVDPEFVTPVRPAYEGEAGYSGARVSASLTFGRERWRFGTFAQYDWLGGAAFEDSPLFQTEHAFSAGVVLMYRLYLSIDTPAPPESEGS